jgi:ATP/ADP translocase
MFVGTVGATLPYVAFIMLLVIGAWIVAVSYLGKQFQALVAHNETLEIQEPAIEKQPATS